MALVGRTYSELVAAMPLAGGEHNYVSRGMGARWAFICSRAITGGSITIVAFKAVALPRTGLYLFPGLETVRLREISGSDVATADGMAALWSTDVMGKVLAAGGIAEIVTSWNSFLIGASRLIFAMGRAQMLPA
ncbi:hypothetical protein [Arthrobacter rhombi]|uniref:hypothetical protein n=1 Tax=Arthrobacter rhombi TaxID=71253 RepID=UPI0031DCE0F0